MRGRPNKPVSIKQAQGTYQPCRDDGKVVKAGMLQRMPEPPDYMELTDDAKQIWFMQGPALIRHNVMHEVDLMSFATYCIELSRYFALKKLIDKEGAFFESQSGYSRQKPELTTMYQSLKVASDLAAHFGFTPASRMRIKMGDGPTEDDFDTI